MSVRVFQEHVRIGQEALRRGFLDPVRLAEALVTIARACMAGGGKPTLRAMWIESGYLNEQQLEASVSVMGADDTQHALSQGTAKPATDASRARASEPTVHLVTSSGTPITPAPNPDSVTTAVVTITPHMGAPLAGRYRRLGLLGAGGLGEVLACLDAELGRTVAVKATRTDHSRPDDAHVILEREASIIASLEHPNIVPVYDAGHDEERGPFYVMRQLTQPPLEQVLSRLRARDPEVVREYTLGRLLRYFVQVCRALDYAHSRGVVHCDLKPANILLGEFGEVLVVDWGLAQSALARINVRGGTPGYMAPEQYDPAVKTFDARTDVFALGAILYEILTLERAFETDERHDATVGPAPLPADNPPPPRVRTRTPEVEITSE
ncbi:MAG TPA: serine/threonine-protein kinase, partial [Gemmatimonadales bacterium]|nr:serine/threonine-protein kinase [Gemmatimonadales bacterium]